MSLRRRRCLALPLALTGYAASTCSSPTNGDSFSSSNGTTARTRKRRPLPTRISSPGFTNTAYVTWPTSERGAAGEAAILAAVAGRLRGFGER